MGGWGRTYRNEVALLGVDDVSVIGGLIFCSREQLNCITDPYTASSRRDGCLEDQTDRNYVLPHPLALANL